LPKIKKLIGIPLPQPLNDSIASESYSSMIGSIDIDFAERGAFKEKEVQVL
jgi:hypothetical protein